MICDDGGIDVSDRSTELWRLALLLLCAFQVGATQSRGDEYPSEHGEFLKQTRAVRKTSLASYPPREQVELYLSAMLVKHPPQLELADVVAASGPTVLPIIIDRIRREEHDFVKVDLLYVVVRMQELGYIPVSSDARTMAVLQAEVSAMKDDTWRGTAEGFLKRMISGGPVGKATLEPTPVGSDQRKH